VLYATATTLVPRPSTFSGDALDGAALEEDQDTKREVHPRGDSRSVLVTPLDDPGMEGQGLRADDEERLAQDESEYGDHRVHHTTGAKEGDPHREIVASEGQRERERRDRTTTELLARGFGAVAPCVPAKRPGSDGERPTHGRGIGAKSEPTPPASTMSVATPIAWAQPTRR
jgi:hypothetical protein